MDTRFFTVETMGSYTVKEFIVYDVEKWIPVKRSMLQALQAMKEEEMRNATTMQKSQEDGKKLLDNRRTAERTPMGRRGCRKM